MQLEDRPFQQESVWLVKGCVMRENFGLQSYPLLTYALSTFLSAARGRLLDDDWIVHHETGGSR
jgi:hypothetical protein